jgi:hypothetical protein
VEFKEIGWNGFVIRVPEEMHLTRQGGDAKQGTFLIESEGKIIEFSWNPIPKRSKSLLSFVEKIVDRAKKEAEKKDLKFTVKERRRALVNNHDAIYLLIKSVIDERYYIWLCQESDRIVAVRFIFQNFDEKARSFVKHFLSTLECHREENNVWSLMKIRFETPKSLLLTEAKFGVGRAHIALAENKLSTFEERSKEVYVDYFSMANLLFKDTYQDPGKWFEKNFMKEFRRMLRKWRVKFETIGERNLEGHKAVIKQAKTKSGFYTRVSDLCSIACWYCQEMNRMYFVAVYSKVARPAILKRNLREEEHNELFDGILQSFRCH